MLLVDGWTQFKIIATGNGEKLEDWNGIKLLRPDPQIIWPAKSDLSRYPGLAARYVRSAAGGGAWEVLGIRGQEPGVRDAAVGRGPSSSAENVAVQKGGGSKPPPYVSETHNPSAIPHSSLLIPNSSPMPDEWNVSYRDLTFRLKPMGFKHTGLFPEQAANWDLMRALIRGDGEWGMGNTGVAFALAPPRSAEGDKDNILSAFEPRTPNPEPRKQNSSASSSPLPPPPPPPTNLKPFPPP
ncbi:MAG: hypothetical protein FWD58_09350, partial [Firmicutes bacterium]|nr:hypothetical protein [Bacillota bacterium]